MTKEACGLLVTGGTVLKAGNPPLGHLSDHVPTFQGQRDNAEKMGLSS